MDLVGIFHVVDMPSSGKCDFNYTHVVGLIQFIFLLSGVYPMFMFWKDYCPMSASFSHHFLAVGYFSDPSCCPVFIRYECLPFCLPWMTMV